MGDECKKEEEGTEEKCKEAECPEVQAVVDAAVALANTACDLKCENTAWMVQTAAAMAAAAVGYDLEDVCEEPCPAETTECAPEAAPCAGEGKEECGG